MYSTINTNNNNLLVSLVLIEVFYAVVVVVVMCKPEMLCSRNNGIRTCSCNFLHENEFVRIVSFF